MTIDASNPAEAEIRRRIASNGPITFAEFMDAALYWPGGGYYSVGEPFGASGDYYTSPMAHPAFGALLSLQLFQMWQQLDRPASFTVVELGAGDGLLCRDLLTFSANLPGGFRDSLSYLCLDRRAGRGHEAGLPQASRAAASGVPLRGALGCVLSNEYLDAFPVHQVQMADGQLREVFVGLDGDELAETLAAPSTPELARRLDGLGIGLAEGQRAEINLGLGPWARAAADALGAGFVLTIDYGNLAPGLYSAQERPRGSLTTYYRHTQTDAPLRRIGRQDISAQVDFTSVTRAGDTAGLATVGFTTQRLFLENLGWRRFRDGLASQAPSTRLAPRDRQANLAGLTDLVRPGGLGSFKVLVQGKNVPAGQLWGLAAEPAGELEQLLATLPTPLLTDRHVPLAAGGWPQPELEFELERLWPGDEAAP
jgi:SAM-dependent MidA family methyltransferase